MSTDWHSEETYKGLILLSQSGLRFGALVNGGAAVALLAVLGDLYGESASLAPLKTPMVCFIVGITLAGLAQITAYITQLRLYNESALGKPETGLSQHRVWLYLSVLLVLASILLFLLGAYFGASFFTTPSSAA